MVELLPTEETISNLERSLFNDIINSSKKEKMASKKEIKLSNNQQQEIPVEIKNYTNWLLDNCLVAGEADKWYHKGKYYSNIEMYNFYIINKK